jgi:hypothetical protein
VSSSWRDRFGVTTGAGAAVAIVLLATGHPRSVGAYLGAIAAFAALSWFVSDVVPYIRPVSWEILRPPHLRRGRGDDIRAMRLSHRLTELGEPHSDPHKVWQLLVQLIDDRLRLRHNIDRGTDPDAAADVLGARLSDFVTHQPSTSSLRTPDYLSGVVGEIEAL